MITIDGDFKGSMLGSGRVEKNIAFIELKKDPITSGIFEEHDYNLHFNFRISNHNDIPTTIRFFINCKFSDELHQKFRWIWINYEEMEKPVKIKINGRMSIPGKYHFILTIKPGNTYISNYIPINYENVMGFIRKKAIDSGAIESCIGNSVEGRDISVFEYIKNEDSPFLLFLSGFHPPENDLIAIETIVEQLAIDNRYHVPLKNFNIALIPLVNPDGYFHNTQGSNANGINFYWKFFGNTKDECPESYYIYEYCKKVKPIFYMDFHAFTFQNFEPRPYNIPPLIHHDNRMSQIQKEINELLSKECGIKYNWSNRYFLPVKIIASNLLSTKLINEFDTIISPKFHMHYKYGIDQSKDLVNGCFKNIIKTLNNNKLLFNKHKIYEHNIKYILLLSLNKLIFYINKMK